MDKIAPKQSGDHNRCNKDNIDCFFFFNLYKMLFVYQKTKFIISSGSALSSQAS